MPTHKVKLEICGSSYVVSTNDSEEYLLGLAERLDKDMNRIMVDTPNASVTAAAVITALSYLDEAEKSAFGADNMRAQIQDYLEDAAKAKQAAETAKRECERLRRELEHYEKAAVKTALAAKAPAKEPAKQVTEPQPKDEQAQEQTPVAVIPIDGQIGIDEL